MPDRAECRSCVTLLPTTSWAMPRRCAVAQKPHRVTVAAISATNPITITAGLVLLAREG
jgi:spore maturation protein SpmA